VNQRPGERRYQRFKTVTVAAVLTLIYVTGAEAPARPTCPTLTLTTMTCGGTP
jgi:hypothetical protein